ncbi:MAG: multidrug efflux pump subunit AcrB [Candidatus Azotimanducaceae bacterium]|jgi:multidrug efflux pump subunit AcrB
MMRSFVAFVVTNRLFTILFVFLVVLAALTNLPNLRISQLPTVEMPTMILNVRLPGASAREIEQRVINPIEERLETTRNLNRFEANISNSHAMILMEYSYGVDIDDEYVDINSKINNLLPELPDDTEVTVAKQSPIDIIVTFVVAVVSNTATEVERIAISDDLKRRLREVPNLAEVVILEPEQEIKIELDLARLHRYGIDVAQVRSAIQGNNRFLPTGTFELGDKAISVLAFSGGYKSLDSLRDTMLISHSGSALALRDVATVRQVIDSNSIRHRVDGSAATFITMKTSADANVFTVKSDIDRIINKLNAELPEDAVIEWLFDVSNGVEYKLRQLITNIAQGVFVLTLVLLFSVGWRSGLVIAMMLPISLLLSVVGLSVTDYGIQEISLAGFVISLGLIVDNGIVVGENVYKNETYRGMSSLDAAIDGASSVMSPLLSATATTALAFAPLFLLTSPTGLFLHSMVATIWLCLAASLISAVAFSTLLLSRIGTHKTVGRLPNPPSFLGYLAPIRDGAYVRLLRHLIKHPLHLLIAVLALLAFSGLLASKLEVIVFPDSDDPFFSVTIEAPNDRSRDFVDNLTKDVRSVIMAESTVEHCGTVVGGGFPFVHTGIQNADTSRSSATLFCTVNFRDSEAINALTSRINAKLADRVADANILATPMVLGGEPGFSDVQVHISGPRIEAVRYEARKFDEYFKTHEIEGILHVDNPASSRWYAVDIKFRERVANAVGVSRAQVDQMLVLLTFGAEVDKYRDPDGNEYPIVLRADTNVEDPFTVFDRVFVTSASDKQIPLSQVVEYSFSEDEYDIRHDMFQPELKIGITAEPYYSIPRLTQDVKKIVAGYELPEGYAFDIRGEVANTEKAFSGAGRNLGLVSLVVLAIFVLQFKSLLQPLIILVAIPLSFIGAFLMLWLTNQPLSFLAFIGLTSLMGIVINNSILLVDEGNQLRAFSPGEDLAEVAIRAGTNRFMPIVLTSLTSIFGLLPLALGNSMFKGLAVVVIGGLTTSTFLTLLCVPVLYSLLTSKQKIVEPVTQNWSGRSTLGESEDSDA